jgi:hypothetical protein
MIITTTEQAILIILAIFLAIFLILGCVAFAEIIQLVHKANRIGSRAEDAVNAFARVGEAMKENAQQFTLANSLRKIFKKVSNLKK